MCLCPVICAASVCQQQQQQKLLGLPYSADVKIDLWLSSNTAEISLKCLACCNKLGATISYICSPPTRPPPSHPTPLHGTTPLPPPLTVLDVFLKPFQMLHKLLKKKKKRKLHPKALIHLKDTVPPCPPAPPPQHFATPPPHSVSGSHIWLLSQNLRENQVVLFAWLPRRTLPSPPSPHPTRPSFPPPPSPPPSRAEWETVSVEQFLLGAAQLTGR